MIISHKHKFIFLKTIKTAGTSIQVALREHCGKEDIITGKDIEKNINKIPKVTGTTSFLHHEHVYLHFVKKWLGPEIWNNYFKFAFIRNPFDLAISKYYWDYKKRPGKFINLKEHVRSLAQIHKINSQTVNHFKNFREYIKDGQLYGSLGVTNKQKIHQTTNINQQTLAKVVEVVGEDGVYINYEHTFYPWLCDPFHYKKSFIGSIEMNLAQINPDINPYDKGIEVDFVGRYEQLDEDIDYIGKMLGLKLKLPKLNTNTRDKTKKIHEYYDEETMFYIEDYFKYDLDKFWKPEGYYEKNKL
tara:strand:- start:58 stop:960 length:903 start_codon:yes stop_codon:yes gene_type:complete